MSGAPQLPGLQEEQASSYSGAELHLAASSEFNQSDKQVLDVGTIKDVSRCPVKGMADERLVIGEAIVDCVGSTPRCGAVTRAQPELCADTTILRTIVKDTDQNVGV